MLPSNDAVRDEIKSPGKISILSQFKIAGGGGPSEGESLISIESRWENLGLR